MLSRLSRISRVGRVDDEAAVHQAHAHRADRAVERNIGEGQRSRGAVDADHVGVILGVGGEHERDDLGLAAEAFGEQRTNGAVDLAAGEDFALAHASFALDEAAGNASAGVGVLAVVHGEREEVDALAGLGIGDGGGQHHVFAQAHHDRAVGLLGQLSGFKGEAFSAGEFDRYFVGSGFIDQSFWAGGHAPGHGVARRGGCQGFGVGKTHVARGSSGSESRLPHGTGRALLADAELGNDGFVAFGVVLLQVVQQATPLADQHEKTAARAMVFLVRFEVLRQLTDALAQQRDLDFGTAGIGGVRAVRVNYGLLLLSG